MYKFKQLTFSEYLDITEKINKLLSDDRQYNVLLLQNILDIQNPIKTYHSYDRHTKISIDIKNNSKYLAGLYLFIDNGGKFCTLLSKNIQNLGNDFVVYILLGWNLLNLKQIDREHYHDVCYTFYMLVSYECQYNIMLVRNLFFENVIVLDEVGREKLWKEINPKNYEIGTYIYIQLSTGLLSFVDNDNWELDIHNKYFVILE